MPTLEFLRAEWRWKCAQRVVLTICKGQQRTQYAIESRPFNPLRSPQTPLRSAWWSA